MLTSRILGTIENDVQEIVQTTSYEAQTVALVEPIATLVDKVVKIELLVANLNEAIDNVPS